jgi:endonuclease/exonuclease/phosphatase family metal-dependent hydrolase
LYDAPMRIRLVSWNIHKGIGGLDRRYRLERVVAILRSLQPDVALLQEVAQFMPRSHFHDQAELLQEILGMPHWAHAPQHRFSIGGYGNAILSQWPLSAVHAIDLTLPGKKKRGALHVRMRVPFAGRTRSMVLFNLHLGLGARERRTQLQCFLASHPFEGLHQSTPIVVAGDFNDLWGTLGPQCLEPAGFRRAGALSNTFPAMLPMRPLDGIFHRGSLEVSRCQPCRTAVARQASDHLPLVADLLVSE